MANHTNFEYVSKLQRFEHRGVPIYLVPDMPDWFVPTPAADRLLKGLCDGMTFGSALEQSFGEEISPDFAASARAAQEFLERIRPSDCEPYRGRGEYHEAGPLHEAWFHITNRCNMACAHCMFCSTGSSNEMELEPGRLVQAIDQAAELGASIFYFTGGEPFVYPVFTRIVERVLERPGTHVVILTNGLAIRHFDAWLGSVPRDRVHFQLSIDGDRAGHEKLRGNGTFALLRQSVSYLRDKGFPVTLAMTVTDENMHEMESCVGAAHEWGAATVHFLWLFRRGRAGESIPVNLDNLSKNLWKASARAAESGVTIDNLDSASTQVFAIRGTRFDLTNSAWQTLAVGPDGGVYPSAAMIGLEGMRAGLLEEKLESIWHRSGVMAAVRSASLVDSPDIARNPLRFLTGGGDCDHSFNASGSLVGGDPYLPLYEEIVLELIARYAMRFQSAQYYGIRARMGEFLHRCDAHSSPVDFTRANCVQSIAGEDGHGTVRDFYSKAAESVNEEILNPVNYDEAELLHVPVDARVRSYGCGSPVLECAVREGETLVDLGSGTGIECFIAARKVGRKGRAIGIDMADAMLGRARKAAETVRKDLGYHNVEFRKGFLEHLPLESESVDVVISNCVINLTSDKRATFAEIFRALEPGGRLCISDIVRSDSIPVALQYNEKMRGECLGGALQDRELFGILADSGFVQCEVIKRFPYRTVGGYRFYSVTYRAYKPGPLETVTLLYRGPHEALVAADGTTLAVGIPQQSRLITGTEIDNTVFELDSEGAVLNIVQESSCCIAPGSSEAVTVEPKSPGTDRHHVGCLVCGEELEYSVTIVHRTCAVCGLEKPSNAVCANGHFVCDVCHSSDSAAFVRDACIQSTETDLIVLYERLRRHPSIPQNGPDYHVLVPAVITAVYRNRGGDISDDAILTAIERGGAIPGGACAFMGICGAAVGVGAAFSIILGGTPFEGKIRQSVMLVTARITEKLSRFPAARCCQRDSYTALVEAARFSKDFLPVELLAEGTVVCTYYRENAHCLGKHCELHPAASRDFGSAATG